MVDVVLVGLHGDPEPVRACLRALLSFSGVESDDLLRQVLTCNPVTLYEDLSEGEANARAVPFMNAGACVELRPWASLGSCVVFLVRIGLDRIKVIGLLCNPDAGHPLADTLRMLDDVPVLVRRNLPRKEAEALRAALLSAGAEATVLSPAQEPIDRKSDEHSR